MRLLLTLISGIAWTFVYVDGVRIGIKDKSYAMPIWALGLNFAWEVIHSFFSGIHLGLAPQTIINILWAIFDIGLIITYFRYGHKYVKKSKKDFMTEGIGILIVCFMIQVVFILEFDLLNAATYSAFLQNLLMSILFVELLKKRQSSEGQTMLIAWSKFIGTLAPTFLHGVFGVYEQVAPSHFVLIIGFLIAAYDLIYIFQLDQKKRSVG